MTSPTRMIARTVFFALAAVAAALGFAFAQPRDEAAPDAHAVRLPPVMEVAVANDAKSRIARLPRVSYKDESAPSAESAPAAEAVEAEPSLMLEPANAEPAPEASRAPTEQLLPPPPMPQLPDAPLLTDAPDAPVAATPWWEPLARQPLRDPACALRIDVNALILDALRHSPHVRAISDEWVIAETAIVQAEAEFDLRTFMDTKMINTSVPTGSVLDAGFDVPRLREEDWGYRAGVRQRNAWGGEFEISQRIGTRVSNSNFFFPDNQGNSRLTLSYSQPLLRGYGRAYNHSLIVLADIETRLAWNRMEAELEEHLLQVTEAYWELHAQRATFLQLQRRLDRAEVIVQRLERRRGLDALESQIVRARAAAATRRTELIEAAAAVRNTEARLRALVGSPALLADRNAELAPVQAPLCQPVEVHLHEALLTALRHRPEIDAAFQEIEAARVRLDVAKSELRPALDVVLESYVSGLQGDYDLGRSWADQFSTGQPSYTAGLVFEMPLHRRAAKAQHARREMELRQLTSRLQAAMEMLHAEVEVAVRNVQTAWRRVQSQAQSVAAAEADVEFLERRWEALPGDDRAASFLLADLLDAQDRLTSEEQELVQAQVDYTLSLTQLNRVTGTLLHREHIEPVRTIEDGLAGVEFKQAAKHAPPSIAP